jgi:hypothetical protein
MAKGFGCTADDNWIEKINDCAGCLQGLGNPLCVFGPGGLAIGSKKGRYGVEPFSGASQDH